MILQINWEKLLVKLCTIDYPMDQIQNLVYYRPIPRNNIAIFNLFCNNNRLDLAKWYLTYRPELIAQVDFTLVLATNLMKKRFAIAEWLVKNLTHKINYSNAFRIIARNKKLKAAQWLNNAVPGVVLFIEPENVFVNACDTGNWWMAQWLLSLRPELDISFNNDQAFRYAASRNHLNTVKWLLSVKPDINVFAQNDSAFRLSCWNMSTDKNTLNVAEWLSNRYNLRYNIFKPIELFTLFESNALAQIRYKYVYQPDKIRLAEPETCVICWDTPNKILRTSCAHYFCSGCIINCLNCKCEEICKCNVFKCPYCRQQISRWTICKVKF